jgi:hypothetical protein
MPPVSTTPAANFATGTAGVVDTGGKFATGVNGTCGKFAAGVNIFANFRKKLKWP